MPLIFGKCGNFDPKVIWSACSCLVTWTAAHTATVTAGTVEVTVRVGFV